MSTVTIPTRIDGTQRYNLRCSLAGKLYAFEFLWNLRDSAWWLTLSDASGNPLLAKKITLNTPMTWRYANPLLPKGELMAVDTSGQNAEAGLTDLGSRVLLTFTDAADLP